MIQYLKFTFCKTKIKTCELELYTLTTNRPLLNPPKITTMKFFIYKIQH